MDVFALAGPGGEAGHTMTTLERVHPARSGIRSLSHWTEITPWEAAELVRRDVLGGEQTLPPVWLMDGVVAPIVNWRRGAIGTRDVQASPPILSRARLGELFRAGAQHETPSPLTIVAFVAVQPMAQARRVMAWLSGYAAVAVALPRPPGHDPWEAFECDYRGFTVAEVGNAAATAVVQGRLTGRGAEMPADAHSRLLEEQLFDLALRHDLAPGQDVLF